MTMSTLSTFVVSSVSAVLVFTEIFQFAVALCFFHDVVHVVPVGVCQRLVA